jgi:uncharacterized protein (DUF58 family)
VTRRLPVRAQVGRAHLVEIEVYNHKKRVPSYAIEVEDLRAGQPADKRCFFLKISPSSAQVAAYRRTPARRGRDRHTGFRIATRFPFGLFEKSREVDAEGELIIYPAVDPVRLPVEEPGRQAGGGAANGRGTGDETFALRPMRQGDDPRDIYWRKSTQRDQIILRERGRETRPDCHLIIDNVKPANADESFGPQFEKRIRDVASRAVAIASAATRTSARIRCSVSWRSSTPWPKARRAPSQLRNRKWRREREVRLRPPGDDRRARRARRPRARLQRTVQPLGERRDPDRPRRRAQRP